MPDTDTIGSVMIGVSHMTNVPVKGTPTAI
jgi:hypothetical protein